MNSMMYNDINAKEYPDKIAYKYNFIDISNYLEDMHPHIFRFSDIMYSGISETIENDKHKIILYVQLRNTQNTLEFKLPFSKSNLTSAKFFVVDIKQHG